MPNVFSAAPTTAPTTAPDSPPPTLDLNMDAQGMHPASPGGSTQCFFDSDDEEDRLVLEDEAQMWQAPGSPAPTQYGDEEQLVEEEAVWKIVSAHRVAGQTAEFKSEGFLHGFRPYRNSPKRGGRECGAVATLALISSPYTSPRQAARRRLLAQVRKSGARAKPAQLRVAVWSDLRHPPLRPAGGGACLRKDRPAAPSRRVLFWDLGWIAKLAWGKTPRPSAQGVF